MTKYQIEDLILTGYIAVDSGQAMIGDPCYLDEWDTNKLQVLNMGTENVGAYSYEGACATTLNSEQGGVLGSNKSVVFSTGYGDGAYPVYVQLNEDGRVSMAIIDFENNVSEEEEEQE